MSNGRKLSGSGSNQSPPKIFSPGTAPSDSSSALTEENVKRLEKEYTTSKEAFNRKRIRDYIKQSNLALSCNEVTGETSTGLVWDGGPEGAPSSFPAEQGENSKEVCQNTYGVISRKDKLLTAQAINSPSAHPTGSKPKEFKLPEAVPLLLQPEVVPSLTATSQVASAATQDVVMLSGDAEIFSEPEVSEASDESEEEARAEEGEENSPTEQSDQAVCEPAEPAYRSSRLESEEESESSSSPEEQEDNGMAAVPDTAQVTAVNEESASCTFCGAPEKPIPTGADLKEKPQENLFCCRSYKKVFNSAIHDLMSEDEAEDKMGSASHADDLQAELRSGIKEKVLQQLDEGDFQNYREILQQYLKFVSRKRISFRLSKPNDYTIRPKTDPFMKHQPPSAAPEDLFEMDRDFVAEHLKVDADYPSGNTAILIAFTEEAQFTYIILEDNRHPGIQAAFGSRGHGISFHPNGHPWTILSPRTGICFDQAGVRQKHWNWHDLSHHVHSPPFQPITMKLNSHLTLKIVTQDKIRLRFMSHNNCIYFNLGARLKLKDPEANHLLKGLENEEECFLQSKKIQLRGLLSKVDSVLQLFWLSQPQ